MVVIELTSSNQDFGKIEAVAATIEDGKGVYDNGYYHVQNNHFEAKNYNHSVYLSTKSLLQIRNVFIHLKVETA